MLNLNGLVLFRFLFLFIKLQHFINTMKRCNFFTIKYPLRTLLYRDSMQQILR